MVTTSEIEALVVGAVASAVLIGGAFYVLRRLRLRHLGSRASASRPELASDRAYNRAAMARREADLLQAQGVDVSRARELLGLSDRSFQVREFDRAYELAQSAHETLVTLRQQRGGAAARPPLTAPPVPATPPVAVPRAPPEDFPLAAEPNGTAAELTTTRPPKNKLESHFQLRLLESDLAARGNSPDTTGARELFSQAQAAFGREEYTEALRLALKGRRQLGGAVETLGPTTATPSGRPAPPGAPAPSRSTPEGRCAKCGRAIVAGDAFCRGCGTPYAAATCPKCGAPRTASDAFCGRCGQRYD